MIFVGDDWSEEHHDVYVCDEDGTRLVACRLVEDLDGLGQLHGLLAEHCGEPGDVVVGIETDRGPWVQGLIGAGYVVYAINPKAAARYRERHSLSGAKSDRADAKMLAELVRIDRHNHRPVAGDTPLVDGVQTLARGHQSLIWERVRQSNRLRAVLRECFPQAAAVFKGALAGRDALAVLVVAPTPAEAAGLGLNQLRTILRDGGRQRGIDKKARELCEAFRSDALSTPAELAAAQGAIVRSQARILIEINRQIDALEHQMTAHFDQHPDAGIYRSLPGVGTILGARMLGEFGDDPNRYSHAKARRNYAGTSPITRASGKLTIVSARTVRNHRLADATYRWAFCAMNASPGAKAFYEHRRTRGDTQNQALRALANRLVGILHGCLRTRTLYDEQTAWAHRPENIDELPAAA